MVAERTRLIAVTVSLLVAAACADGGAGDATSPGVDRSDVAEATRSATARVLLVGDAMLGRGIAPIIDGDSEGLFRDVRHVIRSADIAAVNVESPLTDREHEASNPHELEADPASARLLASAGFDIGGVANNHAGDAGRASVLDSIEALNTAGMRAIGGGSDLEEAMAPAVIDANGLDVAFLAFDVSGQGMAATVDGAGIAHWDAALCEHAVQQAREMADIVVVGIHGGIEYLERRDPLLTPVAQELARWGVDVVWGHGPHVEQPMYVIDPDGDGRSTIVATSLGNFVFDQTPRAMSRAPILEVLVDADGVVAHRVGDRNHDDLRVHFTGWRAPSGDAVMLEGSWWTLDREVRWQRTVARGFPFSEGEVVDASLGDLDGDGEQEILVSYRHDVRERHWDAPPPTDDFGRSAHIGVVEADGAIVWMSRRPPHPVKELSACDGGAAFSYVTLDRDEVISTSAGSWSGFGFVVMPELPGPGTPGCSDVDGDGLLDPIVTRPD